MKRSIHKIPSRRSFIQGVGACSLTGLSWNKTFAQGILRGAGDRRTFNAVRPDTGERLIMIYWIEGNYLAEAIEEFSYFCRDLETNAIHSMDPRVLDIAAATYHLLDPDEPLILKRGFVSDPRQVTNGDNPEAKPNGSFHANGTALDVSLNSRSVSQISRAAISCNAGGVGRYSKQNYVHIDCNEIREWGN
jgi:uncharacterized protein YcbK (DUF882 family)